jgi:hypothetical protein
MLLAAGVFGTTKERRRSVERMFVRQEDSGLGELGCDSFLWCRVSGGRSTIIRAAALDYGSRHQRGGTLGVGGTLGCNGGGCDRWRDRDRT